MIRLVSRLNKKPIRKESERIETLMYSVIQKTAIYELQIWDTNHEFTLKIESNEVKKEVLLEMLNPNYSERQKKYAHLNDRIITYHDNKMVLPTSSSPAHLFAIRGRRKRGLGTLQTPDQNLPKERAYFSE